MMEVPKDVGSSTKPLFRVVTGRYLSEQRLPERMFSSLDMNDAGSGEYEDGAYLGGECMSHDEISKKLDDLKSCPLEAGELQIVIPGTIYREGLKCSNDFKAWLTDLRTQMTV